MYATAHESKDVDLSATTLSAHQWIDHLLQLSDCFRVFSAANDNLLAHFPLTLKRWRQLKRDLIPTVVERLHMDAVMADDDMDPKLVALHKVMPI